MDDLISRVALKKAIAVARTNYNTCPDYNELFKYFSEVVSTMIDEMPAVDAVEVVRCKDCAHSAIDAKTGQMMCALNGEIKPDGRIWYGTAVDEMYFCGYGETPDERQQRELAEQDAYEQLCNLGNPEDGSL